MLIVKFGTIIVVHCGVNFNDMDRTKEKIELFRERTGRFVYIRGKYPHFEVGDTLASYYDEGDFERTEGKVEKIELDATTDDWVYTFEGGEKLHESTLIDEHYYKI